MSGYLTENHLFADFKTNVRAYLEDQGKDVDHVLRTVCLPDGQTLETILSHDVPSGGLIYRQVSEAIGASLDYLMRDPRKNIQQSVTVQPVTKDNFEDLKAQLLTDVFADFNRTIPQGADQPRMDEVVAWWKETNGDLRMAERIFPFFDLVERADNISSIPRVHHVGAQGLSARALGSNETSALSKFIERLNEADIAHLNHAVRIVENTNQGMITPMTRQVFDQEQDVFIEVRFVRLMLPVETTDGSKFVLNYSTLLHEGPTRYALNDADESQDRPKLDKPSSLT